MVNSPWPGINSMTIPQDIRNRAKMFFNRMSSTRCNVIGRGGGAGRESSLSKISTGNLPTMKGISKRLVIKVSNDTTAIHPIIVW